MAKTGEVSKMYDSFLYSLYLNISINSFTY
nr:MAG TPA: hypothetical protein [Caudoviricetes sp.]